MKVYNIMETFVDMKVQELFKNPSYKGCKCERCAADIKALALNHIKPKYVVSERGEVLGKMDIVYKPQQEVNILAAVTEAAEIVQSKKSHA